MNKLNIFIFFITFLIFESFFTTIKANENNAIFIHISDKQQTENEETRIDQDDDEENEIEIVTYVEINGERLYYSDIIDVLIEREMGNSQLAETPFLFRPHTTSSIKKFKTQLTKKN